MDQKAYEISFLVLLEFTPLEFETARVSQNRNECVPLEFTPLEFETPIPQSPQTAHPGLEFTPLEFETKKTQEQSFEAPKIRIYSVGV